MATAIAFLQWENYEKGLDGQSYFETEPLTFNSRQERLHLLIPGDRLWLVSRCPSDQQYYFVAMLFVVAKLRNSSDTATCRSFGEFGIQADRSRSHNLGRRFPAEGLLRAFEFDTRKPIEFGASIGRSLMTIRILDSLDEYILELGFAQFLNANAKYEPVDPPFALWTKCDGVFADYFLKNWRVSHKPVAFMLYDSPPNLGIGSPVFVHSDKSMRLLGRFVRSEYITAYKPTTDPIERLSERERFWSTFRAETVDPPSKNDFDAFWDAQHGVRSMFLMDDLSEFSPPLTFKLYGKALEWGYPMGVGYRYLNLSQTILLLRQAGLAEAEVKKYLPRL